jgi:myosin heavy subunit
MAEDFIDDIIGGVAEIKSEAEMVAELKDATGEKDAKVSEQNNGSEATPDEAQESVAKGNDLPDVKELATQLGWRENHQGEDAVDAATYILRSKDIQKSMSQHNKDLKDQLHALNNSVNALKVHNESVYKAEVKKLESEVAELKKERTAAIELADVEKVEELDKQIDEKQKDLDGPKVTEQVQHVANPIYDEWVKNNGWYLENDEMAKFADAVAQQYVGAPLDRVYNLVRTKVQEVFPEKFESDKTTNQVKTPVGPPSPVERSSAKGNNVSFTKADLTDNQVQIMNQFVRGGIMTEDQYIADIAKMQA